MSRTIVYVDGFNLYYSLKKNKAKWLDLSLLCKRLLTKNDVVKIKYFTAKVSSRLGDLDIHIRQNTYLRALATLGNVEVIYGHFLTNDKWMVLSKDIGKNPIEVSKVQVIVTEEKGSDVNIATHMLIDGFQNQYETAALISNDSDLKLPVEMVRTVLKKPVGVICPHPNPSRELKKVATFFKSIKPETYLECQFANTLVDKYGKIHKPKEW